MQSANLLSFLSRSLEKILKERDIRKSYHADLKTSCENVLEELKKGSEPEEDESGSSPSPTPSALPLPSSSIPAIIPEHYFLPFEKACTSRSPRIICTALDCLQKLIAYGHLRNNYTKAEIHITTTEVVISTTHLLNRLVEAICSCFTGPTTDEGVQLQIIKALLTIVTSPHISIHEGTVLLTIRTVYNIYLASKSSINSTTAKGTLSQMLNVIYMRMESEDYGSNAGKGSDEESQLADIIKNGLQKMDGKSNHVEGEEDSDATKSEVNSADFRPELEGLNGDSLSQNCPSDVASCDLENYSTDTELCESQSVTKSTNSICTETEGTTTLVNGEVSSQTSDVEGSPSHVTEERADVAYDPKKDGVASPAIPPDDAMISESTDVHQEDTNGNGNPFEDSIELERPPSKNPFEDSEDEGNIPLDALEDEVENNATRNPFEDSEVENDTNEEIETTKQSVPIVAKEREVQNEVHLNGGSASQEAETPTSPSISPEESKVKQDSLKPKQDSPKTATQNPPISLNTDSGKRAEEKPVSRIPSQESLTSANGLETPTESSSYILDPQNPNALPNPVPAFNHILQKDAFLIFRALCKLSMKPLPENSPNDPKSHELRSKILSLQLLLSIVVEPGQVFKTNPVFITAIKQYLCISLNKNGLSPVPVVFELSMKIFVHLLIHFRAHLRSQIEFFFKEIIFPILESSSHSSTPHKLLTLNSLISICSNAQIIVDLYLNYDCDLGSVNIYERLVNDLSKIATDSTDLRIDGIRGLVGILQCMDEWSRPKEDIEEVVDNPVQFEVMKSHKNTWEQGLFLFNRKPSEGIKFMQVNNLLGKTATEIAIFFHTDDRVDKTGIGEYLGDPDALHKQVMHAYVDQFNFKDQEFVTALRYFLQGFRLPGEAQKIDRLMEKFASRYCECNPTNGIFTSADTAYVLAYSIIMLTTDLHSPQVKTKMTKEQYIRMNRGINDSRDLPEAYLSGIYDEIAGNEIKMKNIPKKATGNKGLIGSTPTGKEEQNFTEGKHLEHIRPMFKLAWTPFLASFSVGLQDSNEQNISTLCLEGIRLAIHIACIFQMRLERDAYIQALARFTLLNTTSLTEMKSKNINSIKTLIIIGQLEGNYLDTAWLDILKAISSLELAQLVGTRSKDMSGGSSTLGALGGLKSFAMLESQSQPHQHNHMNINLNHLDPSVKESITSTSSQSILVAVDRIFTGSTLLDGDSIVHFVRALCTVSLDELTSNHPRMFSLQKIVEISYYNMSRIRLEWSRIWEVLGDHFNHVGCLTDEIAFFAIDSLRQLSMKFIEKGEFTNFRFQKDFLRPFEYIMKKNPSPSIRDMIVRCITQMIHQSGKIRSGWKNIFSVLSLGANDMDPNIVEMCFITTNRIIAELYSSNPTILLDSFQNGIKCLSEFACNTNYPDISMESIRLIRYCGTFVDQAPDLLIECMDELNIPHADRIWVRGWFPILFELSCIIGRCNLDVRTRGLTVMFEIIKTYGYSFQPHWWKDLFQVIFRIFDNMKLPEQLNEKKEWMTTTCNHALFAIIDVFTQYYDILGPLLMDELFKQLQWCIEGDPSCQLSISAIHCLEHLVLSNGSKFNPGVWKSTVEFLRGIAQWMSSQGTNVQATKTKRTPKQLSFPNELILTIDNIVFYQSNGSRTNEDKIQATQDYNQEQGMYPYLNDENLLIVLDTLACFGEEPYRFLDAMNTSLRLLFRIYEDPLQTGIQNEIERRLMSLNMKILKQPEWTSLLVLTFQRLNQLPNEKFQIHTTTYYPLLCELMTVDADSEVKRLLKQYFLRIGCVYAISTESI